MANTTDGPRERLRAWKVGDPPLPQHTLDNLHELEDAGKLSRADVLLLAAYEAAQVPPVVPRGPVALLGDLATAMQAASVAVGAKHADPGTLGALMKPAGGLKAGDTVVLADGEYADKYILSQKIDGTPEAPIVFVGGPGVVVSGVIAVDNPNVMAYGLLPSKGGRVRCGGYAVQVSFDQQ